MNAKLEIDGKQFQRALEAYLPTTRKSLSEVLNQRAFNIAARTIDSMKPTPGGEQAARARIKNYMQQRQAAPKLAVIKYGKKRGQLRRVGKASNILVRANLIIQARRSKKGLPGLYGQGMVSAEGKFTQAAQVGVGFLKSPFVAVIKGLIDYVRFKKVATRWGRISVWPGSKGYGTVNPANPGINPVVTMKVNWATKGQPTRVQSLTLPHLQAAFNAEASEMMRHVQEKLQKDADRINARNAKV